MSSQYTLIYRQLIMESHMSVWDDVIYDETRAQRAIEELERMAARLDALTRGRENMAEIARVGWEGGAREGFERRLTALVVRSEDLAHHLRRAATTIEADLEAATREQRRREGRRSELTAAGSPFSALG